ncbi:DUF3806 domain-containing protein [Teredinibacter sp. KSP-S5-2]|uniref:DUF3806 domain-containing protein n=1 Tax=Teredinibacter sp. KSP-S5-2 TaxID=3034506 RepID=UPI002934612B|nr:DUF3806 domain-containing protein [Teredinibacter sp. KSP-S5-2]WNO11049.1 DUF3806 domain-containing protein [Teredinibacter sp. KSP-S5-2]
MKVFPVVSLVLTLTLSIQASADSSIYANDESASPISELNWLNQNFLEKQRKKANEITRSEFGSQFHGNLSDLSLLQRVVDEKVIKRDDTDSLQAIGVILGDVYASQYKSLEWKVYEDELGKSHAVCVKDTQECIFPITMLSRRLEAGLNPNVKIVYEKGLDLVKSHMPTLPFSDDPY